MTATTALTLATMSNDRFVLGLGASGPQVVEGWHGQQFGSTVQRLREYIEIVRLALTGEKLSYEGELYRLPRPGGEGKPIKLAAPTREKAIPIYLATLSPKTLELTGEIADGWVGTSFMPEHAEVHFGPMKRGAERAGRSWESIDRQAGGTVAFSDDVEPLVNARKKGMAFQLGAMGSRRHNFYNQAFRRAGYEDVGNELQRLYLDGRRAEAADLIPDEMITQSNLLGTRDMVKDRIRAYRDCGVTTLRVDPAGGDLASRLETLGQVVELVREVDQE
jgi:F420-dependent oxidoreductase-like protein